MDTLGSFIVELDLFTRQTRRLDIHELDINPEDLTKIYWIHADLTQSKERKIIRKKLGLPQEVIELCSENQYRAQLIDSTNSLSLLLQSPQSDTLSAEDHEAPVGNLLIHLTSQFCFTASEKPILAIKNLLENYSKGIPYAKTPCFVLFLLIDDIINTYSDLLYDFELASEEIDVHSEKVVYHEVVHLKRQLLKIKRFSTAIRDVLMRISGRKIAVISDACRLSLQNLLAHSEMIVNEADSIRDLLSSILDQIDNSVIQQVNGTMKVLTGFAAIFLPLTLISGIYGMNFHWIPELDWKYGYFWALGLMAVSGLGLFFLFKKKNWF
jgi:magnesium transporter